MASCTFWDPGRVKAAMGSSAAPENSETIRGRGALSCDWSVDWSHVLVVNPHPGRSFKWFGIQNCRFRVLVQYFNEFVGWQNSLSDWGIRSVKPPGWSGMVDNSESRQVLNWSLDPTIFLKYLGMALNNFKPSICRDFSIRVLILVELPWGIGMAMVLPLRSDVVASLRPRLGTSPPNDFQI